MMIVNKFPKKIKTGKNMHHKKYRQNLFIKKTKPILMMLLLPVKKPPDY
jgi:hypothetical protein